MKGRPSRDRTPRVAIEDLAINLLQTILVRAKQQGAMAETMTTTATILIVEDEILIRMDAADYFADEGFHVLEAGSADEALVLLESRDDIDFVFSDINMPGSLDGLELCRRVSERWPRIGAIITSGMMRPAKSALPKRTLFFEKPYEFKRLLESLQWLGVSRAE